MAVNVHEVEEGLQEQTESEEVTRSIDTSLISSSTPTACVSTVYDKTNDYEDVTGTVMPAGAVSITGTVVTLKEMLSLTRDHEYWVDNLTTIDGNKVIVRIRVKGKR